VSPAMENPNCRATGIGSTPHTDPTTAVDFVLKTFPDIPFWPQLPRRTFKENMYVQFSEHLPGIQLDEAEERISAQLGDEWLVEAEPFFMKFLEEDPACFAPSKAYAAGLREMTARGPMEDAWAVKGQVTGPISFGLQVVDQDLRPSLYDDMMRDAIVKNVLRQAQWQETQLHQLNSRTLLFIDEPFLSMFGSAFAAISREQVIAALDEVYAGLTSWTGTHCCANTDWSLLMETSVDVIAFDAYGYAETLVLSWGSNEGPMREAMTLLAQDDIDVRFLSVPNLAPRPDLAEAVAAAERTIVVECNASGQFADVVEHDTLTRVDRVRKYDGVRFTADELAERVRETLAEGREVAA